MKKVEMWQTKDGKLFKCREDAELHIIDKICEVLGNNLEGIEKKYPWFTKSHVFEMVDYITGDYKKTESLITQLNKTFE